MSLLSKIRMDRILLPSNSYYKFHREIVVNNYSYDLYKNLWELNIM